MQFDLEIDASQLVFYTRTVIEEYLDELRKTVNGTLRYELVPNNSSVSIRIFHDDRAVGRLIAAARNGIIPFASAVVATTSEAINNQILLSTIAAKHLARFVSQGLAKLTLRN